MLSSEQWVHSSAIHTFTLALSLNWAISSFFSLLLGNTDAHTINFHLESKILWWFLDITVELNEMNVMSINNDFLSHIGLTFLTNLMWWRLLVNWPVVEWWVNCWVSSLGKSCWLLCHSLGGNLLFLKFELIWSNQDFHTEFDISHCVLHHNWVHKNWHTLRLGLSQRWWYTRFGSSRLLLGKRVISLLFFGFVFIRLSTMFVF